MKWPPEIWPTAEAITPIASPCANATATSVNSAPTGPGKRAKFRLWPSVRIEPAPMKTNVNVPTNSAEPRRSGS